MGVLTQTARVHAAAWKERFDAFPCERAEQHSGSFVPFDPVADNDRYRDGELRNEGVRSFLAARGIELPSGDPDDPVGAKSVAGLGNRKTDHDGFQRLVRGFGFLIPGVVRVFDAAEAWIIHPD